MMNTQEIQYDQTPICSGCWPSMKQVPSKLISHQEEYSSTRISRDKKLSLKKVTNSTYKKPEQLAFSPRKSVVDFKEPRQSIHQMEGSAYAPVLLQPRFAINPKVIESIKYPQYSPLQKFQRCAEPIIGQSRNCKNTIETPRKCYVQQKAMSQTTKMGKFGTGSSDELRKTRKVVPFVAKPMTSLLDPRNFKQSVCSINDEQIRERLEQSQVVMDYFHPNELRKAEISHFINSRNMKPSQSLIGQQRH